MRNNEKEKWMHLYDVVQEIGAMNPWEDFTAADRFACMWKDQSKTVLFSFIGASAQTRGIACYIGEEDYMRARIRLTMKNEKREPAFMLQNALICLWSNREDVSKENYALIKELGLKFRGKGAWLSFERYEIGFAPVPLTESDVELLITAFENLYMMLRAVYERGLDPEFDKGKTLLRWYEPKDDLFYTYPVEVDFPKEIGPRPVVIVQENDWMREVRTMKSAEYSVEIDWSYAGVLYEDELGRETFPKMLLAVERKKGLILFNMMLPPSRSQPDVLFGMLDHLIEQHGKPTEIVVCDEDIKGILADICKKIGIKMTVKKRLSALNKVRNDLLDQIS